MTDKQRADIITYLQQGMAVKAVADEVGVLAWQVAEMIKRRR